MKFLRQDRIADAAAKARLRAEGELGLRVRSPHVARIYGVETLDVLGFEMTYLVMELVEGPTLRTFLDHAGPAVEDFARRIGLDAARGLAALHDAGIVHRDIKPENLALTPGGNLKIMDLGFARPRDESTGAHGFVGSLAYAAPEVLRGQPANEASDLYALGLVLFEVVTGQHPFHDITAADAMITAHLERGPPRTSHLVPRTSPFLEHVIADLLAKPPARRFGSAASLAATLADGEASRYWNELERAEPALASRRRLRALQRFAPTPFYGRRGAAQRLDRLLRSAVSGRGRVVRVIGPQGAGRRRLLDVQIDRWLRQRDDVVLFGGTADRGPERTRGAPFPAILRDWFLRGDDAGTLLHERLTVRISTVCGWPREEAERLAAMVDGKAPGESPAERAELFTAALLCAFRARRTVLVRIDRADALDDTGRRIVETLGAAVERRRGLLLLVHRPDPKPYRIATDDLHVRALSVEEFVQFGSALFAADAPQALIAQAWPVLGGLPGNLLEALEALVASGASSGTPGAYRMRAEVTELTPPGPLLQRLRERVRSLNPQARHVVLKAAILGERFEIRDLVALTGLTELRVLEALSVFDGRIVRAERGHGRFQHKEFRRALLDLIPDGTAKILHRDAAWILEERGAPAIEVGLHLSRAFEHAASIPPLLEGLEHLVTAGSTHPGKRVARRIAIHLDALPDTEANRHSRLALLLLQGQNSLRAGELTPAQRSFADAFRVAGELTDLGAQARAMHGLAQTAAAAGFDGAAEHFRSRSAELATESGPNPTG